MRPTVPLRRIAILAFATGLLATAAAGNVLAAGVEASASRVYAGLPGHGGRLVLPYLHRADPTKRAAERLLITTAENAPDLELGWEAAARAAIDLDPRGNTDPPAPHGTVVLTETHAEGRVHTVHVHPDALDTSLPVHPGPTHHEGGSALPEGGPALPTAPL